jgi:hypothetical protein
MLNINSLLALLTHDHSALMDCREAGFDDSTIEARVHIALRGSSREALDDPVDPFHPARAALRKRPLNVHNQYHYRLAVVDFHLAGLRYLTGLPALDDLYYRHPDAIPTHLSVVDRSSFATRLTHFQKSWRRLDTHARWLDGLLQSTYRTEEAESRLKRCKAIAQAVG